MKKLYKERDAFLLDNIGGFYGRHVMAMTSEGLHSKSAIAGELAYRDFLISDAKSIVKGILEQIERGHKISFSQKEFMEQFLDKVDT